MKKIIKFIFIVIILFIIIFIFYQKAINNPAAEQADNITFTVLAGQSVDDIGESLSASGLIKSKFYFKVYLKNKDIDKKIQAGDYFLSPSLSIKEIADILANGQALIDEKTIKIIEGWRMEEINKYLTENGVLKNNEFLVLAKTKTGNWDYTIFKGASPQADLEGFLFPDTYRIFSDATAEDIIVKMLDNLDKKITVEMREDIESSGRSIYEIIILASLIEKEVRDYSDMRIVSGIFRNRIKNGQPLESCATLAYILGENKKQYSIEDTQINSDYNTYKNQGLPPGPICNPGVNAIKAAIYSEETEYNYFLSRFDNGETVFGKSYQEHLANKAKYLK
ncbi:endolytic transglycosylase MltG [Candidatus Falkowbacteria bacterium]|nr:MAG: endolytic transglycosylase MltG [Candidatus Falkowbacteria bacterium]